MTEKSELDVLLGAITDIAGTFVNEPVYSKMASSASGSLVEIILNPGVIDGLAKTLGGLSTLSGSLLTPESLDAIKGVVQNDELVESLRKMFIKMADDGKVVVPTLNELMALMPNVFPAIPSIMVFALSLIGKNEDIGGGVKDVIKGVEKILEIMK